ncbi:restriction endonuclease subunit S [Candidatus Palauibacter sp.]|uniref:restriction endonuclease subunit S n=1 Tax=Candidatus Palauibacter sp. TaxID=3101350 RepID=UPI003C6F9525
MKELPKGWIWTTLGDVCSKPQYGWTTKGSEQGRIRLLRTTDIANGTIDWSSVPFCAKDPPAPSRYQLAEGDIVISRAGSVGVSALLERPIPAAVFASYLIRFKALGTPPRLIAYYLQSPRYWAAIGDKAAGIAIPNVNATKLAALRLPLVPLPEQHRIVARIESLFAELDKGIAALKRAEVNLERYRASFLKAAVEGRLTELWRHENPPVESGEELLRRILAERRKRWEEEQLAKFKAKERKPPRNWKAKYKEPVAPDTRGLPGLPDGWCWATVDQVALRMRNGRSVRTRAGGFPVLRLGAITGDVLDDRDFKYGDWGPEEAEPFRVRAGDFFVSRGNGSLDLVGRAAVADQGVGDVAFPDTMIRVTFACTKLFRARFGAAIWNSQIIRRQITESAKTSAGIYKINQADLQRLHLPLPPVLEQDMIIGLHHVSESVQSHLGNRLTVAVSGTSTLHQSILKRAFEGRLVPQDPADEPASILLERIRAERETVRKKARRRTKRTAPRKSQVA